MSCIFLLRGLHHLLLTLMLNVCFKHEQQVDVDPSLRQKQHKILPDRQPALRWGVAEFW